MANKHRGEVAAVVGERKLLLRPTHQALCAIEGEVDAGIITILGRMAKRDVRFRDLTAVIVATAEAGGTPISAEEVGDAIETNLSEVSSAAMRVLAGAFKPAAKATEDDGGKNVPVPE